VKVFKTNCPYCEEENIFEVPTYQESLDCAIEELKKNPNDEMWLDMKSDLESENDLSALDDNYIDYAPIFCKECGCSYFLSDVLLKTVIKEV